MVIKVLTDFSQVHSARSLDSFSSSHMKAVTLGAAKLVLAILAILIYRTRALPPIQKLPSPERPFVLIHVVRSRHILL